MTISKMNMISLASCFFVLIFIAGCGNPRQLARQELDAQLARRHKAISEADELYSSAMSHYSEGNSGKALELSRHATEKYKRDARPWMLIGAIYFEKEKYSESAHAFRQAELLEPVRPEPSSNLGTVYEYVGRFEKAVEQYELALGRDPGNLCIRENLARCLIRMGRYQQAILILRDIQSQETRPEWKDWIHQQIKIIENK